MTKKEMRYSRSLLLIVAAIMVLAFMPVMTNSAKEAKAADNVVLENGKEYKGQGISWNGQDSLSLNNYNGTPIEYQGGNDIAIAVKGNNTITTSAVGDDGVAAGIKTIDSSVTLTGNGSIAFAKGSEKDIIYFYGLDI